MSKSICQECTHFKNEVCVKNEKNGYNNCKKWKAIPISEIQKEYKQLLISRENPERLAYLKKKLEFMGY